MIPKLEINVHLWLTRENTNHIQNSVAQWLLCPQCGLCFLGALYPDNTTSQQKEDDRLQPGAQYTYKWYVEEKQGPGPNDSNCVTRIYHSHVDTPRDVPSGLVGPILTCKRGNIFLKSHCSNRTRKSGLSPAL